MLRKLLSALVLALLPSLALAGGTLQTYTYGYALTATAVTYCKTSEWTAGQGLVTTGGVAAVAVTAATGGGAPFAFMGVGDDIQFVLSGVVTRRTVATWVSSTSITVNSNVTIPTAGTNNFAFKHRACGTAVTNGWLNAAGYANKEIVVAIPTLTGGSGGIDLTFQCRFSGDAGVTPIDLPEAPTATPINFAAAGTGIYKIPESCESIRVGQKWKTSAGTTAVGIWLYGEK